MPKLAQPTVGRQVEALERKLDVALFERIGKRLVVTPAGLDLLEHVRVMGEAAQRVALTASGRSLNLDGPIRITAGEAVSAYILPPVLEVLRAAHPEIEITVVATGQQSNLQLREADIAIRNAQPSRDDLIARRTPTARRACSPGATTSSGSGAICGARISSASRAAPTWPAP